MRILLVQAYLGRREKPVFPIGLCYVASSLKNVEVKVVDPNVLAQPVMENLRREIVQYAPQVIGVSLRNLDTTQYGDPFVYFPAFAETVKTCRAAATGAALVVGGPAFSVFAEQVMKQTPEIDFGVYLEGENTFPRLLEHLGSPHEVKGVFYRQNGGVKFTGRADLVDFASLPPPKRDFLPMGPYLGFTDALGVQTKRGCALECAYCTYSYLNGKDLRVRTPEHVADEVEELVARYGVKQFIFSDSVFNLPREHCRQVCDEIKRRKLDVNWTAWFNEKTFDQDMIRAARDAGCAEFSFSPDAFSDKSLRILRKNISVADIRRCIDLICSTPGAKASYNFFGCAPGQRLADLLRLLALLIKAKTSARKSITAFTLGKIRLEPHTEMARLAQACGRVGDEIYEIPPNAEALLKLFYSDPEIRWSERIMDCYYLLKKAKRRLMAGRNGS